MKKLRTLVFILVVLMLITCGIVCASAATYTPVGPLKVGRVRQDDNGGDCFRCSVATVEAYALGSYSYGGYSNTYSYGNDYVWSSDPVWRHLDALGGVSGLYNLPIPLERQSGLSLSQMLSLAYDKLREGSPVAIWAPRVGSTNVGHASIIIGYNGNSSQLSASDFTIMEVKLSGTSWWSNSVEYFNKYAANPQKDSATGWPMSCYVTLDSWISYCSLQSSFSAVYIPQKQVVAPPAPTVTTDKSAYTVGDTVTITCGNTELSGAQWLTFYHADTKKYIYNQTSTGQFTFQFKLELAGRYDIYYQTSNAAGASPQTHKYFMVFRTTAPETPTLALSCTNPFKVQLKLQTNAVVDGFEVERTDLLTNETVTLNVSNEKLGTAMTYVDSGLQSEHTYSYRVRAFNNVEGSVYPGSYSDAQTVQTISQYPDPSQPAFIEVGTDGVDVDRGDFYCLIPPQIVKKWGIRLNEPDGNVYEFTYLCGKDYFCEDALEAKFGTYLDHRLQSGKQSIVFWYVDWQGVTHEAEPYEFTTLQAAQKPTNFRATAVTGSSVTLSWDPGSSDVSEYCLYRALNIGTSVEYEAIAYPSSSDVSYTDTGLLDGMDYLYYLRVRSAHGAIAETDPITVTTTSTAKPADSGFESVYVQNVTSTNAELIANISLTYVKYCGFDFGTDPNQMIGKSEPANQNVLLINYDLNKWYGQLTPGTRYYYRFWYETSSETIVSGLHSFYTVPSAPVLQSVEQSENSMKLTWKPTSNATYYDIFRSEDGGEMKYYTFVARGSNTTYKDTNVKRGVQYSYQVRAVSWDKTFDLFYYSETSNTVAAPAFTYVERPGNVTAAYADQKITVSWTAGEKCDSYLIERSLPFSFAEPVGTVDGSTLSFTDTTAQPGNTYRYWVSGICGSYQSNPNSSDYVNYPAQEATEIRLSAVGTVRCRVGDRLSAEYTVYPQLDDLQEVRWTSSAEDVVSVDGAGVLTANKEGTSRITAIATDGSGCSASFTLKVDGSKGVFTLPAALTTVESGAFAGNTQMALLVLSDQPELTVLSGAFEDCYRLSTIYAGPNATSFQEDSFPTQNRLTFCCARGSYAYQYAIRNGFNYLLMQ